MPHFLTFTRIDWHYEQAPAARQEVIQIAHASLSGGHHTEDTFREGLEQVASEQRALVADALIQGTAGVYALYRVEKGQVRDVELDERPADALGDEVDLPYDNAAFAAVTRDAAGIRALIAEQLGDDPDLDADPDEDDGLELPLTYRSEAALREVVARVAAALDDDAEADSFVAEADGGRFLVELAPGRAVVRRLAFAGAGAAVAERLLRGAVVEPPSPASAGRDAAGKYEVALFWPEELLAEVQAAAVRTDRSLSFIIQLAWKTAAAQIAASEPPAIAVVKAGGRSRKQALFMPGAMVDRLEAEASRLDVSQSRLIQHAFALARPTIAALPADAGSDEP